MIGKVVKELHTPVLTAIIFIFILWLQYEIRKSSRKTIKDSEAFWEKENQSNHARRKDISQLDYLTVQTENLPLEDHEDETLNSYRDTILRLKGKRILNLSGISNTELKSRYGVANINSLSEYDNNYTILISMLQKWADRLYSQGFAKEAAAVLEYGVSCRTDVWKSYLLLADLYRQEGTPQKINDLIRALDTIRIHDKDQLIQALKNKLEPT